MLKLHPLVIASLFCGAPVSAETLPVELDEIFSWVKPEDPGCSVAVQVGEQASVARTYGLADLESGVPIATSTRFDAGSVQKQFVAATILLLERDGLLSLTDDVRKHVPEMADYGVPITVDHLLTHTSGLRDWTALELFMPRGTPIIDMILAQRGLNFPPGEEWSYSNSNYVLLKEIVERVTGQSLPQVTHQVLFDPLAMRDTAFVKEPQRVEHRALAYAENDGDWIPDMRVSDDRGGGVLFTTAPDLLNWTRALATGSLGAGLYLRLTEPARLNNGRILDYGRGLMLENVDGAPRLVWHSGGAGGYSALAARFVREDLSIAILCNAGDRAEVTHYSRAIFEAEHANDNDLFEAAEPAVNPNSSLSIEPLAGDFMAEGAERPLRLVFNNGHRRIAGGPPLRQVDDYSFRLAQTSRWFMSQDDPLITFVSPDTLELTSKEGSVVRYGRVVPATPAPEDLAELAGRYRNDDTGGVIDVSAIGAALLVKPPHLPVPVPMEPLTPGMFGTGPFTLFFSEDHRAERYFELNMPLLRKLRFDRVAP